ncbi:MAG: hypothetical protein QOF02_854 [Blastocatellia bacterium]|jgi:hypothetical protein|nr:hypothetical protein [Blastocatellia bacterium]
MSIAVEKKRILTADNLSERILPPISGEGKARVLKPSGGYA